MADDRPMADGVVETGPDGSTHIRFVRRLPYPIERIWAALTDHAELRKWWGDADLEPVEGGRFALRWLNRDDDGNVATLDGAIRKIDPPRILEISGDWGSTGDAEAGARTSLTWELEPDGDETVLRFTNTIAAPGQGSNAAAGWHMHLDALATVLDGGQVDIAHPDELFQPIQRAYEEQDGSAAT